MIHAAVRNLKLGALGAAMILMVVSTARAQMVVPMVPEDPPVTAAEIEAALSPYGEWLEIAPWGRCWRPTAAAVGDDFAPYLSSGRWLYGTRGWTFDSQLPWGWAAFHFGRWIHVADHGWVWTQAGPLTWSPAWVAWRTGGGFTGWIPLLPAGAVVDPAAYGPLWSVVAQRHLSRPDLARHLVAPDQIAFAVAGPPGGQGAPVGPLASWRGFPGLRAALLAASGTVFVPVVGPPGTNPMLWFGRGSSMHAPIDMAHGAGASPLWTGPGSSVHASPAFGEPGPAGTPRGWTAAPRRPIR